MRSLVIDNGAISASQAGAVTLAAQVVPSPAPASLYSQYASTIAGWASGKQFTTLCYSKQQHGASSSAFHSGCDGRGASLTIMRLSTGRVIGGYTSASWSSSSGYYSRDCNAFLFSITNNYKHTIQHLSSCSEYAMYRRSDYGPTFGNGHDLLFHMRMRTHDGKIYNLGDHELTLYGTHPDALYLIIRCLEQLPDVFRSLIRQSQHLVRIVHGHAVRHILVFDNNAIVVQDKIALEPRNRLQIANRLLHNVLGSLGGSFSRSSGHLYV